jgi:hypothetical protein
MLNVLVVVKMGEVRRGRINLASPVPCSQCMLSKPGRVMQPDCYPQVRLPVRQQGPAIRTLRVNPTTRGAQSIEPVTVQVSPYLFTVGRSFRKIVWTGSSTRDRLRADRRRRLTGDHFRGLRSTGCLRRSQNQTEEIAAMTQPPTFRCLFVHLVTMMVLVGLALAILRSDAQAGFLYRLYWK